MDIVTKAAFYAAHKHKLHRCKDLYQTPYINHLTSVAYLIANVGEIDCSTCLAAAYLQDIITKTKTSYDDLSCEFGKDITKIVREITRDKSISKVERKKKHIVEAFKQSYSVRLIELATILSRLINLVKETPTGWSEQYKNGYIVWTYKVVEGLKGTNILLEKELWKIFDDILPENTDSILEEYYILCEFETSK